MLILAHVIKRKDELDKKHRRFDDKTSSILMRANMKADDIIGEATQTSKKIIRTLAQIKTKTQEEIDENVEEGIKDTQARLNVVLEDEMNKLIKSNSEDLRGFVGELKQKAIAENSNLDLVIKDSLARVIREVEEYKKEEISEVDASIDKLILSISKEYLREYVPVLQHKKLVFEALEKAKKEGLFS